MRVKEEIKVIKETYLKPSTRQVSDTPKDQLIKLSVGQVIPCERIIPHLKHYALDTLIPMEGHRRWYVYDECVQVNSYGNSNLKTEVVTKGASSHKQVKIKVPFLSQADNAYHATTSCFLTSVAMIMAYHGVKPTKEGQLEDELYKYMETLGLNRFYGPHIVNTIRDYGLEAEYKQDGTVEDIRRELDNERPCALGTYLTDRGHIICLTGYSDVDNIYYAHDPWGKALGNGKYDFSETGENVSYPYELINKVGSPESVSNPHDFWILKVSKPSKDKTDLPTINNDKQP